jgi:hypothetical protein
VIAIVPVIGVSEYRTGERLDRVGRCEGDTGRELGMQRSVPADPQRGAPAEGLIAELVHGGAVVRAVDLHRDRRTVLAHQAQI